MLLRQRYSLAADGFSCDDVNECVTSNGDCGSVASYTCTNNVGAPPTCGCTPNHQDNDMNDTCEIACHPAGVSCGFGSDVRTPAARRCVFWTAPGCAAVWTWMATW
jgi:hypothetical protein